MMTYSEIDEVAASRRDINSGPEGWGFSMYSFDSEDDAPHRSLLERFAAAHPEASIKLPRHERHEDFVGATATWNSVAISIYYETLLGYLWLWSLDRKAMESFRMALLSMVA